MLASCAPAGPTAASSLPTAPSSAPTTPSVRPSASGSDALAPEHDLFTPGLAQQVVADLVAAAGWKPVVRVTIDRGQARLTYVDSGDRPASVLWRAGKITPSDDGTDLVAAASFDPTAFELGDIAGLFRQAAEVAGSAARQELQLTEYDHGEVLMTVTTTPESMTVFFDATGQLIPRLDYSQGADIATALAEVTTGRLLVVAVGIDDDQQVWADVVAGPGIVERRFRPANVPMYLAQRRETPASTQFDHALIDPNILGLLLRTGPGLLEQPATAPVTLLVEQPITASEPQISITVNGAELTTDLSGVPVSQP